MIHNQEFTYIGKKNTLIGEFVFMDQTHIAGKVQGSIIMKNKHRLTLEIASQVDGKLQCFDLEIYGTMKGEIHSEGRVTFYPSAHFDGVIFAKNIEIYPGAVVNMQGQTTLENIK